MRANREFRWLISNLILAIVYAFSLQVAFGLARLVLGIPSNSGGNPLEEALGWAIAGGMYLFLFSPMALLFLVPYRLALLARRDTPRAMAFATAAVIAGALWLFAPQRELVGLVGATTALAGYAAIIRLPGDDLASLPSIVQHAISGLLLSLVWIAGSLVAVIVAAAQLRRGRVGEAGALALAGTAGPAVLLFLDLFRDDVPRANYLVTAVLLAGAAFGFGLLGLAAARHPNRHNVQT